MSDRVELVPLECLRCGTPIPAEIEDVAWICANCGQGQILGEETGLRPLTVHFAGPASSFRKPFWIATGHVRFTRRESYGRDSEPDRRWAQPVRFVLPAYALPIEQAVELGTRLLESPPDLREGEPSSLAGVVRLPDEMQALARFVVLSLEAERRDKLEAIEFSLELEPPELWCLPVAG